MEQQEKSDKKLNSRKKQANAYAKYSGVAFQMGITIGLFVFVGQKIDSYFQTEQSYWTAALALLGVFAALYFLLKDLDNT